MGAVVVEVVSTACRRSWKEARPVWHFIQALCIDVVAYSHSRTLSYSPAQVSERTRAPLQSSLLPNLSLSLFSLREVGGHRPAFWYSYWNDRSGCAASTFLVFFIVYIPTCTHSVRSRVCVISKKLKTQIRSTRRFWEILCL